MKPIPQQKEADVSTLLHSLIVRACDLATTGDYDSFASLERKLRAEFDLETIRAFKDQKQTLRDIDLVCRSKQLEIGKLTAEAAADAEAPRKVALAHRRSATPAAQTPRRATPTSTVRAPVRKPARAVSANARSAAHITA